MIIVGCITVPQKYWNNQANSFLFVKHIWVYDQKMNKTQEFRISAFVSQCLRLDVLNNLGLTTFCIRPQHF